MLLVPLLAICRLARCGDSDSGDAGLCSSRTAPSTGPDWAKNAVAYEVFVRSFADSRVGAVSGRVVYSSNPGADSVGQGEHLYWSYENQLKTWESRTGNVVSATGKIYAIRRALYRKPPIFNGTDDFLISTGVIQQGYRLGR